MQLVQRIHSYFKIETWQVVESIIKRILGALDGYVIFLAIDKQKWKKIAVICIRMTSQSHIVWPYWKYGFLGGNASVGGGWDFKSTCQASAFSLSQLVLQYLTDLCHAPWNADNRLNLSWNCKQSTIKCFLSLDLPWSLCLSSVVDKWLRQRQKTNLVLLKEYGR